MKLKTLLDKNTLDFLLNRADSKENNDSEFLNLFKTTLSTEKSNEEVRLEFQKFYKTKLNSDLGELRNSIIEDRKFFPLLLCFYARIESTVEPKLTQEIYAKKDNLGEVRLPLKELRTANSFIDLFYSNGLREYHNYLRQTRRS